MKSLYRAVLLLFSMFWVFVASAQTQLGDHQYVMFYHNDMLGSPVVVTDHNGNTLWHEHSDPYGKRRDRVMPDRREILNDRSGTRKAYTGHIEDEGTDLVYMKARYYDPVIGRFYSNDPIGFLSSDLSMFNRYSYVANNPYNRTDPTGMYGPDETAETFSELSERSQRYSVGDINSYFNDDGRFINSDPFIDWAGDLGNRTPINSSNGGNYTEPEPPDGVDVENNRLLSTINKYNPFKLGVFKSLVGYGGRWDFQRAFGTEFEIFGNFHYGYMGAAFGIHSDVLLGFAGRSQIGGGRSHESYGTPGPFPSTNQCTATCGDEPWDNMGIRMGIQHYHNTQ